MPDPDRPRAARRRVPEDARGDPLRPAAAPGVLQQAAHVADVLGQRARCAAGLALLAPWAIGFGAFFLGPAVGAVVWLGIRNRVRDDDPDDEFPEQIHGNNALELGWTIAPAAIIGSSTPNAASGIPMTL